MNKDFYGAWSDKYNCWCLLQGFGIFEAVIFTCDSGEEAAEFAGIATKDDVTLYEPFKTQEDASE